MYRVVKGRTVWSKFLHRVKKFTRTLRPKDKALDKLYYRMDIIIKNKGKRIGDWWMLSVKSKL